ncbi:MAG: sugar phosphate isomerase/epimerase [Candidatus Methanomethylicia archaeon]|nr:sugar phosphate isomerase/epimerase [Candidatus Methanomethylicia archaeon]
MKHIVDSNIYFWEIVDDGPHFLDDNKIKNLLKITSNTNITLSIHAPFTSVNISASNDIVRRFSMKLYLESIEHAHKLGCKYVIFHPGLLDSFTYLFNDLNEPIIEGFYFLLSLGDLCSDYGIIPLLENLATDRSTIMSIHDFKRFFNESRNFMMALDISHAHITGIFYDYLLNFHNRIKYLHISGNDDRIDRHWSLHTGSQYWRSYLKKIFNEGLRCPMIIENLSYNDALKSLYTLSFFLKTEFAS